MRLLNCCLGFRPKTYQAFRRVYLLTAYLPALSRPMLNAGMTRRTKDSPLPSSTENTCYFTSASKLFLEELE